MGHGNSYDRLFRKVIRGANEVAKEGPLDEGFQSGSKELMLKGSEKAINDILSSGGAPDETKKILRQTGTTLRRKIGKAAKMKLKNKVFKLSNSRRKNSLKGGALLYSLNPRKKSRRKSRRTPPQKKSQKFKIKKKSHKLKVSRISLKKKSKKKNKRKKTGKKKSNLKGKKKVRFDIANFMKKKRKQKKSKKKQGSKKRSGNLFPTVFDL